MTWAGQSVFALPCGSGGSNVFGVTLDGNTNSTTSVFEQIGNLQLSVPVLVPRAAVLLLTGTATNGTAGEDSFFRFLVDGTPTLETSVMSVAVGEDPFTVALSAQVTLLPGSPLIVAQWQATLPNMAFAQQNQLHLEVILGQAVP